MNSTRPARENRPSRRRPPRLDLIVQHGAGVEAVADRRRLKTWARAATLHDLAVTLRFVDRAEGRWLNRRFRRRDYATNVLTFPYPDATPLAGDIVICVPVVEQEAGRQGKRLEAHLAHLVIHGLLHLQGFDHERAIDAELMEGIETEILDKLGYADPYKLG